MKKSTKALFPAVFILVVCIIVILKMNEQKNTGAAGAASPGPDETTATISATATASPTAAAPAKTGDGGIDIEVPVAHVKKAEHSSSPIELTAGNFESFVARCFAGEPCRLIDDPFEMYRLLKAANNRKACDNLIAFLRRQMSDPEFKDLYKAPLKKMIDDFYPPNERQFQDAAYYAYLGDNQRALTLYLDLEKKSQTDPSLQPAPPLNIANILFDTGRLEIALSYYEKALKDFESGKTQTTDTKKVIDFIELRIHTINGVLGSRKSGLDK